MKIKFLQKKPFIIFVIENFLSDKEYLLIKKNFPEKKKIELTKREGNKCSLSSKDNDYNKLKIKKNISIKIIEQKFDEKFFSSIVNLLKKDILISRYKYESLKNLFSLFRKIKIKKNNNKKNYFEKIIHSNYRRNFEFSYMSRGSFITPHTDKSSKLLSLMLYFPTKDLENLKIGTTFHNLTFKDFSNKMCDIKLNKKDKSLTLPFKKRNLYCFIKSDLSWHSVEKLNIPKKEVRKSININLNI